MGKPTIHAFFDEATYTVSYIVADPATKAAAVIDPVLDYDPNSGEVDTRSVEAVLRVVKARGYSVIWTLETHAHADHLSGSPYIKAKTGAKIGTLEAEALYTPGHTPADVTYRIEDAAFVGDTMFMPDYGTARADFPGGDAVTLYRSIRRILALPAKTRLFTCHDYKSATRDDYAWESTVEEQRAKNIHVRDGVSEAEFVKMRQARDATLDLPVLILPSVQVNMRAGQLPPPEANGVSYLKIPVNAL